MGTTRVVRLLLVALLSATTAAQVVHDVCSTALPITAGLTAGSNVGATTSPISGSCTSTGADVWYVFTAAEDGLLVASLGSGGGTADFDTVLSVFSGSCGALAQEACSDDTIGVLSHVNVFVTAGQSYFIQVGGYAGASGHFTLSLDFVPTDFPPNDECHTALPIGDGLITQYNAFATTAGITPPCAFQGAPATNDLWYLYMAPADGHVRASTVAGGGTTNFDTVMAVWTGTCGAGLALVGCNDDGDFSLGSQVVFPVVAGAAYFIEVSGYAGAFGTFTLAVEPVVPPANDHCDTAPLVLPGLYTGDTSFATESGQSSACAFGGLPLGPDVWFRFVPEANGLLRASTTELGGGSADFDTVLAVFSGECGNLVELTCNGDADSSLQSDLALPVSEGASYYIVLGGFFFASGHYALNITLETEAAGPDVVLAQQKISATEGGFIGDLSGGVASFGHSVSALGDLDGDGLLELAVGSPFDDIGDVDSGAVWILSLAADGTVSGSRRIATGEGGLVDATGATSFGDSVAGLGDLDGDGVPDLAVGAHLDDDGGPDHGAIWILFLHADGTVKATQKISHTAGGFGGPLKDGNGFGFALAALGDLDGDGVGDLVSGAPFTPDLGPERGAVWIVFLNTDGTVKDQQRISDMAGQFSGELFDEDHFGMAVAPLGDVDADGIIDVAVGSPGADQGGVDHGAVWVLKLRTNGRVKDWVKIASGLSGLKGLLFDQERMGQGLAAIGDPDANGITDLAVGSTDGGALRGAVRLLFLEQGGSVRTQAKISDTQGGFEGSLADGALWGEALAGLGDLDGDGRQDLAVGHRFDDDGGTDFGAVWILRLDAANKWINLGHALAGALTTPHLVGSGTLQGDTELRLSLHRAAPTAAAFLVLGVAAMPKPFMGGTLVPVPLKVNGPHVTDGDGMLTLTGRWPVGVNPGHYFAFQFWIADAGAPAGFSASNALGVSTP